MFFPVFRIWHSVPIRTRTYIRIEALQSHSIFTLHLQFLSKTYLGLGRHGADSIFEKLGIWIVEERVNKNEKKKIIFGRVVSLDPGSDPQLA
jgi:hypothetical protein